MQGLIDKKVVVIGTVAVLLGGMVWVGHSVWEVLSGGAMTAKQERTIVASAEHYLKPRGYPGQVKLLSAQHNGFSQYGITASLRYTERVAGKAVTADFGLQTADDGHVDPDALLNDDPITTLQGVTTQTARAKRWTRTVKKAFRGSVQPHLTYKSTELSMDEDAWTDGAKIQNWLKARAQVNRNSATVRKRAYNGYYAIPLKASLQHGAAYFRITYGYHAANDSQKNEKRGLKALKKAIKKTDPRGLPDGFYAVGFDLETLDGTSSSATDIRGITIRNGRIVKDDEQL